MSAKKLRRVEVEWEDSTVLTSRPWWKVAEALSVRNEAVRIRTVGFVLADDARGLVVAASFHCGEAAGVHVIPRGQVVRVRRLR